MVTGCNCGAAASGLQFKALCFQARQDLLGSWPWCGPWEGGLTQDRFRYSLTTLTVPRRCLGLARRRVGRGGRWVLALFV